MMRTIGSMKTLSMEQIIEDKRRVRNAARNELLSERLAADATFERAFARLCAMQGLNSAERTQKELNFA